MTDTAKLDEEYFSTKSWASRVQDWVKCHSDDLFLDGNVRMVRQIMEHRESGLRMVLNISAHALLSFLADRQYKNLYESPVIGDKRKVVSAERRQVDQLLGFGTNASDFYFGAVALGGTGVRFYGEYCMVLKDTRVDDATQILDRDSYDLLLPPLSQESSMPELVRKIKGGWKADAVDMLTLKLLPELQRANRLVTTGTVSEMILHDQEFVEVHRSGKIVPTEIEEVRQSPDEVALEARILARRNAGFPPTVVELCWLHRRDKVARALEAAGIQYRIVTLHGRGYQWR